MRINPLPGPPSAKPGDAAGAQAEAEAAAAAEAQAAAAAAAGEVPGFEAPAAEVAEEEHEEAPAAEGEAAAGEAAEGAEGAEGAAKPPPKPRTAGSRDLHKPQFIDFGNPLLVGLLGKMGANLKAWQAIVEERLPTRDDLPRHEGERYATEVVVQLYFPAGTTSAGAHATAEEGHAAAVA